MNKIEVALGILVVLFSHLAILNICFNVTTVTIDPLGQRYAYADNAKGALLFIKMILFLGIATIIHVLPDFGANLREMGLGAAIAFWSGFAFWWVMLSLNENFFKKSLTDELIWTSFPLMIFIFLGITLTVDGTRNF